MDELERKILKDMETEGKVLMILFWVIVLVGIAFLLFSVFSKHLC